MTSDPMRCRVCGREVAAGRFCGMCGAPQSHRRADGPDWLRIRHYCPAPNQHALRPSPVSTLFPQLSSASRRAFGLAAAVLVATLATLTLLRWQAAAIGVGVLGFPVLLATYFGASGALRNGPRRTWILPAALGLAWALLTGARVARSYGVGFGAGVAGGPDNASLAVPVGAVIVMVLPAMIMRLFRTRPARVMDGFITGVLGATSFGVAATVVRLAPQLSTGLVARHRPLEGLIVEAGIRGVVIPMTSAAIGGIAGVGLWFTRSRDPVVRRRRPLVAAGVLVIVGVASGTALADAADLGPANELLLHAAVTVIALFGLRVALHLGLLHESHGDAEPMTTVDCPECGHHELAMPFCSSCGRGASTYPASSAATQRSRWQPVGQVTAGCAAAALGATAVSVILFKPVALYACPPECGRPPTGTAIKINPRYTAPDGSYSVAYPEGGSAYDVTTDPSGVLATLNRGDGGVLRLFGEPARGRDAEQVVHDFVTGAKPNAARAYSIPNAMVGYQLGYGEVDDDYPVSATGDYVRLRLVTVAAVKDDYALIAAAIGPFHQFSPDFGPGPPSAVNLQLGLDMDTYVNSFRWRGDPDD